MKNFTFPLEARYPSTLISLSVSVCHSVVHIISKEKFQQAAWNQDMCTSSVTSCTWSFIYFLLGMCVCTCVCVCVCFFFYISVLIKINTVRLGMHEYSLFYSLLHHFLLKISLNILLSLIKSIFCSQHRSRSSQMSIGNCRVIFSYAKTEVEVKICIQELVPLFLL